MESEKFYFDEDGALILTIADVYGDFKELITKEDAIELYNFLHKWMNEDNGS
jgi:hypothetical protein